MRRFADSPMQNNSRLFRIHFFIQVFPKRADDPDRTEARIGHRGMEVLVQLCRVNWPTSTLPCDHFFLRDDVTIVTV